MKVLLSWVKEYADLPFTVDQLQERLPMLGMGVETVERIGRDDAVFDLEIPANRGDLMSMLGVARELAAAAHTSVTIPGAEVHGHRPPIAELTSVEVHDPVLCPRFTARMIVDVRVGPSPPWLAGRLEACGVRRINTIVDVTNYVMLEMGQPMHAFDYDRLAGARLVVRLARPAERLTTLDGVDRMLDPQTLVVADAERAAGIAGVIGGADTEIGPQTTRVLLEAAAWNPAMIRRTSRRLGVRTESSARFERGVDLAGIRSVQARAMSLMQELACGHILEGLIDVYPQPVPARTVDLRWGNVGRLLGVDVPAADGMAILRSLGFEVQADDQPLRVVVPSFRRDVEREEDLIEDVARHYGYEKIPETMPVEATAQGQRAPELEAELAVRDAMIRAGLTETLTVSLTNPSTLDALRLPADHPWRHAVPLRNPLVEDHVQLRTTLLPGLLRVAGVNASRRVDDVLIFELGRTFHPDDHAVRERKRLTVLMMGRMLEGAWNVPDEMAAVTYYHLKGVLETLLAELRISGAAFEAAVEPWLRPGRAARLMLDGSTAGTLGELHPEVAAAYDLPSAYVADLDADALLARATLRPQFELLPRYPSVRRDISLVIPDQISAAQVDAAIRTTGGPLLEALTLFDVYTGASIPAGHRSLAYALSFRAPDRTLSADEVDAVVAAIRRDLVDRLQAQIRE